jgi:exonuclease SbcD
MGIRFLHTADAHFGVENYGHIDEKTGLHTRLLDFKKSFEYVVDYAIAQDVDIFLFAGDAYKNSCPTPTHQRILIKLFLKLLEKNIPVIIVVGNHDHPGSQIKAHALDVFYHIKHPLCYLFSKPGIAPVKTKSGIVNIIGISWPFPAVIAQGRKINEKEVKKYILKEYDEVKKKINPSYPSILVGHLTMQEGLFSGSEKSILEGKDPLFGISEIHDEKIQYIALGHLHKAQYINKKYPDQNPIVYSGSPDRIDFGEKDDNKGFVCGVVDINQKTSFSFVPIPCRPFYQIQFHIETLEKLPETIMEATQKYPQLEEAIIKIKYSYDSQYIKYINISYLQKFLPKVWHIASIECINKYKLKKKNEEKEIVYQDKNILDMVELYLNQNEQFKENKKEYLEELKKYTAHI